MKKRAWWLVTLSFVIGVAAGIAGAQAQWSLTPHIHLELPGTDSRYWNQPLNYNFSLLDTLLSGQGSIPGLNVTGNLQAPQLNTWSSTYVYGSGNLVLYQGQAYGSVAGGNVGNVPTNATFWTLFAGGGGGGAAYSNENLTYSATPTFSVATTSTRIILSGNLAFSLANGTDGQPKCVTFAHDSSSTLFVVTPPATVKGFMPVGGIASKHSTQCFVYYSADTSWIAQSPGAINQ